MSVGVISSFPIFAAPKTGPDFAKAGKVADECMDLLETGETTGECFGVFQRELKDSSRKTKEVAVTIIYFRLRSKYPYIGGMFYLDEVRDDLLKRINTKNNRVASSEGVRLVLYDDLDKRARQCIDRRYANFDPGKCLELIKTRPLDLSFTAQLHVIRLIENYLKAAFPRALWESEIYPRISNLIYIWIGDSI